MPSYHALGKIPPKRHTQFRKPDGSLYPEELFGAEGFSGCFSLLYQQFPPTRVSKIARHSDLPLEEWRPQAHRHHHFKTAPLAAGGDPISGRRVLMFNDQVSIGISRPTEPMSYYYRNAECDELYFVHEGTGRFETIFGTLPYHEGDYVNLPRGTTYRIVPDSSATRLLVVEAHGPIETPRRYRNEFGQLLEHAPFADRDFRLPQELPIHEDRGEFEVRIKVNNALMSYGYDFHPLDLVGWDGYLYPYIFNIADFEPITGRV